MFPDFLNKILKGSNSSLEVPELSAPLVQPQPQPLAPSTTPQSSAATREKKILSIQDRTENNVKKDVFVDVIDKISRPKLEEHQKSKNYEDSSLPIGNGAISEDILALNTREIRATVTANFINKALLGFGSGLLMAFTIFRNSRKSLPIIFSSGWGMGVGYAQGSYLIRNCDSNK